jgi:hypothetical protein
VPAAGAGGAASRCGQAARLGAAQRRVRGVQRHAAGAARARDRATTPHGPRCALFWLRALAHFAQACALPSRTRLAARRERGDGRAGGGVRPGAAAADHVRDAAAAHEARVRVLRSLRVSLCVSAAHSLTQRRCFALVEHYGDALSAALYAREPADALHARFCAPICAAVDAAADAARQPADVSKPRVRAPAAHTSRARADSRTAFARFRW